MSLRIPSGHPLWLVDRDPEFLVKLSDDLMGEFPFLGVSVFGSPSSVRSAIRSVSEAITPWMIVTDQIGVVPIGDGPSVVEEAREGTPLSLVALYSQSAYQQPGLVPWLKEGRLIDAYIQKEDRGRLIQTIAEWHDRWESPTERKLREYIATCPDPNKPFFPRGNGDYLSVIDLHREIILGTELGKESEKAWEMLFSDRPISEWLLETHV